MGTNLIWICVVDVEYASIAISMKRQQTKLSNKNVFLKICQNAKKHQTPKYSLIG